MITPEAFLPTAAGEYLTKVLYEAAATPVTYRIANWLKRAEAMDAFDRDTDFAPWKF
jgi:hypothetical protein